MEKAAFCELARSMKRYREKRIERFKMIMKHEQVRKETIISLVQNLIENFVENHSELDVTEGR